MRRDIGEIRFGLCDPTGDDKKEFETLMLETTAHEIEELCGLMTKVSNNLAQRVFEKVLKSPREFSRCFGIDQISKQASSENDYNRVVVSLDIRDSGDVNVRFSPHLDLSLERVYEGVAGLRSAYICSFRSHLETQLVDFSRKTAEVTRQTRNMGLVYARLHEGVERAHRDIMSNMFFEIDCSIRRDEGSIAWQKYREAAKSLTSLTREAGELGRDLGGAYKRIGLLEATVVEAVTTIKGTKSSFQSKELAELRERLEAALVAGKTQEGEPQEPRGGFKTRS
mgnify:CR=1 FL=1